MARIRHVLSLAAAIAAFLFVPAASAADIGLQRTSASAAIDKRVAVLLINFVQQPSEPWSKDAVRELYFGANDSVASYYAELSDGQMSVTGSVFGYLRLKTNTSDCYFREWARAARDAARSAGIALGTFTNIVYVFPYQSACWWNGFAGDGPSGPEGRENWINGWLSVYVAAHELGHNFGVGHASSLTCTSGPNRVAFSSNCSSYEYGDPYDVMGYGGSRLMHAWHRWQLGLMADSDIETVTQSGTYRIAPLELSGNGPRMLRIPRSSGGYYFLEIRRPFGAYDDFPSDAPPVTGVPIRAASGTAGTSTKLIDTAPATCTFNDAPLREDRTFTDPVNNITITTVGIDAGGAEVQIQVGNAAVTTLRVPSDAPGVGPDTTPPTAVAHIRGTQVTGRLVAFEWDPADDDVGVERYRVTIDGIQVGTTCDLRLRNVTLKDGRTYEVGVRAVDAAGNAGPLETASYTVPDFTSPALPRTLSATVRPASITLRWQPGTDNVGVTRYLVSRNGQVIAAADAAARSYVDKSAPRGFNTYSLVAFDAAGNASHPVKKTVRR
jgi:hypothetical protein